MKIFIRLRRFALFVIACHSLGMAQPIVEPTDQQVVLDGTLKMGNWERQPRGRVCISRRKTWFI